MAILRGHRDFVRSLFADASRIVSGDFGGFIKVSFVFQLFNTFLKAFLALWEQNLKGMAI